MHAAAHITGGGFIENVPRALPPGLGRDDPIAAPGRNRRSSGWSVGRRARRETDMFSTFNMGVGMVLVVDPENVEEILRRSQDRAFVIGEVRAGAGVDVVVP